MRQKLVEMGKIATSILAIIITLFHLYTGAFGTFDALIQRPVHLLLLVALSFCIYPLGKDLKFKIIDALLAILALFTLLYIILNHDRFINTILYVDKPTIADAIFTLLAIFLVLEASRRATGVTLSLVGVFFLLIGYLLATLRIFPELNIPKILDWWWIHAMLVSTQGLWSTPTMVSATYIFLFVVLASFLEASKVGRFFIDLAISLVGKMTGGPAKIAVFSSSLFGSISGSAAANVYATGIFTIPTMKKFGYSPAFAGAVEAVASTGGQLVPPIMGAAAFVMAEFIGVPYARIMLAAIIPALIYYFANYLAVHAEAKVKGLKGIPEEEVRPTKKVLKEDLWQFICFATTITLLVYMIMVGYSLYTSVFYSWAVLVLLSFVGKKTRLTPKNFANALAQAAKNATTVAVACGVASIIVGVLTITGFGHLIAQTFLKISQGNLILLILLTAVFTIILGMGMPTTAAYILAASLIAPALVSAGFSVFPTHFFIFTYAILSAITPPVALAAFAASNISGANAMRIGFTAVRIGLPLFLLPIRYIFYPHILLIGSPMDIFMDFILILLSTAAIVNAQFSWPIRFKLSRVLFGISGLLILLPVDFLISVSRGTIDLAGLSIMFFAIIFGGIFKFREKSCLKK